MRALHVVFEYVTMRARPVTDSVENQTPEGPDTGLSRRRSARLVVAREMLGKRVMKQRVSFVVAFTIAMGGASVARAEDKSESTALGLSVVPVVAGLGGFMAIGISGHALDEDPSTGWSVVGGASLGALAIGPSLGHWYAGEAWSAGLVLRTTGIAAGLTAVAVGQNGNDDVAIGFAIGAQAAFTAGIVYDLWTVRRVVRERNESDRPKMIVPLVGSTTGIAFASTF